MMSRSTRHGRRGIVVLTVCAIACLAATVGDAEAHPQQSSASTSVRLVGASGTLPRPSRPHANAARSRARSEAKASRAKAKPARHKGTSAALRAKAPHRVSKASKLKAKRAHKSATMRKQKAKSRHPKPTISPRKSIVSTAPAAKSPQGGGQAPVAIPTTSPLLSIPAAVPEAAGAPSVSAARTAPPASTSTPAGSVTSTPPATTATTPEPTSPPLTNTNATPGTGGLNQPPAAQPALQTLSGAYVGAANPAGIEQFQAWRGSPVTVAMDFLATDSWAEIENPVWWLSRWQPLAATVHMVYGVPLIPDTGGSLAEGAQGAYDVHFAKLASALVAYGQEDATLRLGWEFNGNYDRWYAGKTPDGPSLFAAYWRHIVDAMRSVPGANFTFDWNVGFGASPAADPNWTEDAWPGAAYVDYVGVDVYDFGWADNGGPILDPAARWEWLLTSDHGLNFWANFAALHDKPLSLPEWGLSVTDGFNGHGGGDDPYFIRAMRSWIGQNNVAYESYFDVHGDELSLFPQSAAVYHQLWGEASP